MNEQECIPVGCVPFAAVAVTREGGSSASRGGVPPGGVPVDRMTDACENITFLQLLFRTVII